MSKKMLINATHPEESRVATVEEGILTELDIESEGREMTRGNIYKATVVRVESGLQAAFIDYGAERLGFLQMGELHPSFFKAYEANNEGKGRPRIGDILRRGQELLVQVVKEERGTKGAALTTYLSLPGRYMVLMPDSDTKGVSRKIEDESQRRKLKEAMAALDLPSHMGYIVRTAGIGQTSEELKRDFDYLVRVWDNIQAISKKAKAPALVYQESNLVIRSIRDYFTADVDEVLVDDPEVFEEARSFFEQVMPEYARVVKLHQERRPIFARYQIEEQIETLARNKVPLPSGGSIVIDSTEALVAIDVNSGKMAGEQGVEGTAYKTNLEAAAEVGRQLRLRDLGGLIVIDFIDMRDRKHIREIEKTLKDSLKNDKARVTVGRISQFGLLEMSRQRIKAALAEGSYLPCPNCGGSGRVKSSEAQAVAFLRKLHAAVARGQVDRVEGEVPIDVAHYLLNDKREELLEMERRYQVSIFLRARKSFVAGQYELMVHKREKEEAKDEAWTPVTAAETARETTEEETPDGKPAGGETPAGTPPHVHAAEEGGEAGTKRKRRRRRKKKPQGETAATSPATEEGAEQGTAGQTAETPAARTAAATGESSVEDQGETAAKKPRRRRRRRKKTEGEMPKAAAEISNPVEPAAETPGEQPTAPPQPAAEAAAEETPTEPRKEPAGQPADQPAKKTAEDTKQPPAKPARKRPARKKPAPAEKEQAAPPVPREEPAPPAAAEPVPPPATAEQTGKDATAGDSKKTAGPARKQPAKKKPAPPQAETVPTAPRSEATPPAAAEPQAPKAAPTAKPTRKRPARKKSAEPPTAEAAAAEPPSLPVPAASVEGAAEQKPAGAKSPRRRSTTDRSGQTATQKTQSAAEQSDSAAPADRPPAEAAPTAKDKPAKTATERKRTPRSKKSAETGPAQETTENVPAKPAARRTTRKKTTEAEEKTPRAAASGTQKAAGTTSRSRRAKPEPEPGEQQSAEAAGEKPAPKKRAPRKTKTAAEKNQSDET